MWIVLLSEVLFKYVQSDIRRREPLYRFNNLTRALTAIHASIQCADCIYGTWDTYVLPLFSLFLITEPSPVSLGVCVVVCLHTFSRFSLYEVEDHQTSNTSGCFCGIYEKNNWYQRIRRGVDGVINIYILEAHHYDPTSLCLTALKGRPYTFRNCGKTLFSVLEMFDEWPEIIFIWLFNI